jgi:hypothetical protein
MHTTHAWPVALTLLVCGCGGQADTDGRFEAPGANVPATTPPVGTSDPPPPVAAWDGSGYVVHEWGTNTIVVGSDGGMLPGLQHEEEGLPAFVYDRVRAGAIGGAGSVISFDCKLETPITYFYSPTPRSVKVSVDFPGGIFTQWYPAVDAFYPLVAHPCSDPRSVADPYLDPAYPFQMPECAQRFAALGGGLLDWGTIEVLGRDAAPDVPEAPLEETTWAHARIAASNAVRAAGPSGAGEAETERFLFYRGLGNFELPLAVRAAPGGLLSLENRDAARAMGRAFVLAVDAERGAFVEREGVAPGATLDASVPRLGGAPLLADYEAALGDALQAALVETGLYSDEAAGMVRTWRRQWFRTPGVRVLYLLPQALTDALLPLHVDPAPQQRVRTIVIRVEVLTPELEAVDRAAAEDLESGGDAAALAEQHFLVLGRFAEPRLRRALALLGNPGYAGELLTRLAGAPVSVATGE